MRKPVPPFCTLAASGTVLVWEADGQVGILGLDDDSPAHVLDTDGGLVAISPSGSHVAIAGASSVDVLALSEGWSSTARHDLDEPLFRMAVDDAGLVVGVTAHDGGDDSSVVLLDGTTRARFELGDATAFTLLLDGPRRRVLLAGQEGSGSFQGGGRPFVRLLGWEAHGDAWSRLWDGPAPLDEPNGWVMPLTFGDIGAHDLQRLVVVSPDTNPDDVGEVVEEHTFGHLETVAASPDGGMIAWFWRGHDDDVAHVRSARLADGTVTEHPDVDGIAEFPTLAVADDGAVTMVDVVRPSTIRVRRLREGDVETTTHVVDEPAG